MGANKPLEKTVRYESMTEGQSDDGEFTQTIGGRPIQATQQVDLEAQPGAPIDPSHPSISVDSQMSTLTKVLVVLGILAALTGLVIAGYYMFRADPTDPKNPKKKPSAKPEGPKTEHLPEVYHADTPAQWQKLQQLSKEHKFNIVLNFGSLDGCYYCRVIAPYYEQLAKEMDTLIFAKCDVPSYRQLYNQYKGDANGIPLFVFIDLKGNVISRIAGADKEKLRQECSLRSTR